MDGNGVLETYKEPPGRITGYPEVTLSNPASFQNQVILENQKRLEATLKNQPVWQCRRRRFLEETGAYPNAPRVCRKNRSGKPAKPQVSRGARRETGLGRN